jgi:hypothetical protein
MSNQQLASNDIDDFIQGGIYPGGRGIIKDIGYYLWDYGGTRPPDSQCAVRLTLQPTDGANEGKDIDDIWFSVGASSDFQPDQTHGFVFGEAMKKGSNWHYFLEKLRDNCGMPKGRLGTPGVGIRALIGSGITLARVDQPKREGLAEREVEPGKQARKQTILVPTKCEFAWEGGPKGGKPVTVASRPATATASSNGAGAGAGAASGDLFLSTIAELLEANPDGISVEVSNNTSDLTKMLVESLAVKSGVTGKDRIQMSKKAKDMGELAAMAEAQGWTLDSGVLIKG